MLGENCMTVTVLTPTYNRKYVINRLYKSLIRQTCKDFEWLVVDDGSSDETDKEIEKYILEHKITIRYIKQKNGGKHRALNAGIATIENAITFIVDSDDYLRENAIEEILEAHKCFNNLTNICGFSFLRCYPNGEINGPKFKQSPYVSDYITCRMNEGIWGDKAEAYYTKCLKEFPFLETEGEKFLFEDYVWIQMAEKYNTVHINKAIYVGDYLEDGLTNNIDRQKINNPIGMMKRGYISFSPKCNLKNKIRAMMMFTAYGKIAGYNEKFLMNTSRNKNAFVLIWPLSFLYWMKLKRIKV